MARLWDHIASGQRQRAIERTPRTPKVTLPAPPVTQGEPAGTSIFGKIVFENQVALRAKVAPLTADIDINDDAAWDDDENFDVEHAVCCVVRKGTLFANGWAAWAHAQIVGFILQPIEQFVENHEEVHCVPDAVLAPESGLNCPDPENPADCDITSACCKPDRTCAMLTRTACDEASGTFYEDTVCADAGCATLGCCVGVLPPFTERSAAPGTCTAVEVWRNCHCSNVQGQGAQSVCL